MHLEITIAAAGGQGALTVGQLIALTGIRHGKHVTNTPIYSPEVRGGSSNALVVVSDDPIGSMMADEPSDAIFLCDLSVERILPLVQPGGKVVYNTTLVAEDLIARHTPDGVTVIGVPATRAAEDLGEVRAANMIALGALTAIEPQLPMEWLIEAMPDLLGERRAKFAPANIAALEKGVELATT